MAAIVAHRSAASKVRERILAPQHAHSLARSHRASLADMPELVFVGETARRMRELGVGRRHVAVSHDGDFALANVVLEVGDKLDDELR